MINRPLFLTAALLTLSVAANANPTRVLQKTPPLTISQTVILKHILPSDAAQLVGGKKPGKKELADYSRGALKMDAHDTDHKLTLTGPFAMVTDVAHTILALDAVPQESVRFVVRLLRTPITGVQEGIVPCPDETVLSAGILEGISGQAVSLTLPTAPKKSGYLLHLNGHPNKAINSTSFNVMIEPTEQTATIFHRLSFQGRSPLGNAFRSTIYLEPNPDHGVRYGHVLEITPLSPGQ